MKRPMTTKQNTIVPLLARLAIPLQDRPSLSEPSQVAFTVGSVQTTRITEVRQETTDDD
jgi:hypothetical protein